MEMLSRLAGKQCSTRLHSGFRVGTLPEIEKWSCGFACGSSREGHTNKDLGRLRQQLKQQCSSSTVLLFLVLVNVDFQVV